MLVVTTEYAGLQDNYPIVL